MNGPAKTLSTDTPRRTRKPNWTSEETMFLLRLYQEHVSLLTASFSQAGTSHKKKQEAWATIASQLHEAFPSVLRSEKDCQKRWQLIQTAAKPNIKRYNEAMRGTGKANFTFNQLEIHKAWECNHCSVYLI